MHAYIVHFLLSSVMRVPTIRFYTIAPLPFVCDSIQGRTQWNVFLFKVLTHCASAMSSFVYFTPVPSTWQFSLIPCWLMQTYHLWIYDQNTSVLFSDLNSSVSFTPIPFALPHYQIVYRLILPLFFLVSSFPPPGLSVCSPTVCNIR